MRIDVGALADQARRVRAGLGDVWAREAARQSLEVEASALDVDLLVRQRQGACFVTGRVDAEAARTCHRCAEMVEVAIHEDIDLTYVPSREDEAGAEVELEAGDLDLGWYEDGMLDVSVVLAEALVLALPSRILCGDEDACEVRTDALLAARSDDADDDVGHPGLAKLKKLAKS